MGNHADYARAVMNNWKLDLFERMSSKGVKPGELMTMTSGQSTGKSMMTAQAIARLMRDLNNQPVKELVLGESKFCGARFHTVEPIGGNWADMQAWCTSTFGEASEAWDFKTTGEQFMWPELGRWYANNRKFWFRNEADRTLFVLKWS